MTSTTQTPSRHQLALMIWLCVFPTLTVLNLTLGDWLDSMGTVPRTFVLATLAVPIVIYGLMPHLHRARGRVRLGADARAGDQAAAAPAASPAGAAGPPHRSPAEGRR